MSENTNTDPNNKADYSCKEHSWGENCPYCTISALTAENEELKACDLRTKTCEERQCKLLDTIQDDNAALRSRVDELIAASICPESCERAEALEKENKELAQVDHEAIKKSYATGLAEGHTKGYNEGRGQVEQLKQWLHTAEIESDEYQRGLAEGKREIMADAEKMAQSMIDAHDGCGHFVGEGDDGYFEPCICEACTTARKYIRAKGE